MPDAVRVRCGQAIDDGVHRRLIGRAPAILLITSKPESAGLQATQGFLQGFLESSTDGHRFADRLHLRRQRLVGVRELFERPAGDLGHHIIDRGFKTGWRFAGDVVGKLVQPITDCQLGRYLGYRKPRRLGS